MEREEMRERETREEGNKNKVDEGEIGDGEEGEEEEVVGNEEGKMVIGKEIMEAFSNEVYMNPHGSPITRATLEAMPQYIGKPITHEDLAREAMRRVQIESKNIDALSHALQLKQSYGHGAGTKIAVLVLVYNATGGRVELVQRQDWEGRVYREKPPRFFENGQWITFLYSRGGGTTGAKGAQVFRATDLNGYFADLLVAWNIHWRPRVKNSAHTEVRSRNYFEGQGSWDRVKRILERSRYLSKSTFGAFNTTVTIGAVKTSECIAYLQHNFTPFS